MSVFSQDTLKVFEAKAICSPRVKRIIQRETASTYADFVEVLHEDIEFALLRIQQNKARFHSEKEDFITDALVMSLSSMGYDAWHDSYVNGHVDVSVYGHDHDFLWIAEAKRDNGASELEAGFRQLVHRYSTGAPQHSCAGMLIYIQGRDAATILGNWRDCVTSTLVTEFKQLQVSNCPKGNPLAFVSVQKHDSSGLDFKVRHIGVPLYHEPTDKSAVRSKSRKATTPSDPTR